MKAIIILGHGSRVPGAGTNMEKVAALLQSRYGYELVEPCYMSRLGPYFPETLAKCAAQGATEVVLIPYFLNNGLHIRLDIPEMMKKEAEKYPELQLIYGDNLGFDDLLAEIVHKRIQGAENRPDVRELELEPKENFPVPPGQGEFVEVSPEDAKKHDGHHHH
ncbi:MAG: sirohydrochlorin chelatase [bacterium]